MALPDLAVEGPAGGESRTGSRKLTTGLTVLRRKGKPPEGLTRRLTTLRQNGKPLKGLTAPRQKGKLLERLAALCQNGELPEKLTTLRRSAGLTKGVTTQPLTGGSLRAMVDVWTHPELRFGISFLMKTGT